MPPGEDLTTEGIQSPPRQSLQREENPPKLPREGHETPRAVRKSQVQVSDRGLNPFRLSFLICEMD